MCTLLDRNLEGNHIVRYRFGLQVGVHACLRARTCVCLLRWRGGGGFKDRFVGVIGEGVRYPLLCLLGDCGTVDCLGQNGRFVNNIV